MSKRPPMGSQLRILIQDKMTRVEKISSIKVKLIPVSLLSYNWAKCAVYRNREIHGIPPPPLSFATNYVNQAASSRYVYINNQLLVMNGTKISIKIVWLILWIPKCYG